MDMMKDLNSLDYIAPENIPDIPLYMDQLTTFMDSELATCKRYPDDKLLTKTMINNYTKNDLIPPPDKKKYSKDHLLMLIFIYYMKSFLSISDIHEILTPLTGMTQGDSAEISLDDIYREIYDTEVALSQDAGKEIIKRALQAEKKFADCDISKESKEYLEVFSFICMLSFDVYVKKQIIERVVDKLAEEKKAPKKRARNK